MCEEVLSGLLTLGNAVSLLEFAHSFNAAQLKRSALQFVCLNLPAVVENGSLASIASGVGACLAVSSRHCDRNGDDTRIL